MKKFLAACGLMIALTLALIEGATAASAGGHYGYIGRDLTYTSADGDVTYFCEVGRKRIIYAVVDLPTSGPYTGCAYVRHQAKLARRSHSDK